MRRLSIENKLVFIALVLMLTLGVSSVAQAQAQSPNVWLKVNGAGTALEGGYHDNNNSCDPSDTANDDTTEIGYFCYKKGNNGLVNIHLPPYYSCGEEQGYKWEISKVVAGGEGVKSKANVTWGGLSKGAAEDLGVPDASTGVVTITPASGGHSVHFKNDNKHEVVIWYKVDAACRKGDETDPVPGTISLDPRGRNGGTN